MLHDHPIKMPWLFQEGGLTWTWADVDSQEKALISTSSTLWWDPAEAICRTMELNSYPGVNNLFEKKGIPKWWAPCSLWIAVLWLKCRNGIESGHRRNYVTRQSLGLLSACLFSASPNMPLSWHGRGDLLLRKKAVVRLGWWHVPQECYPTEGKSSVNKKSSSGICLSVLTALWDCTKRLLYSSHSWPEAVPPVRVSQLANTGVAVNPDVYDEAVACGPGSPGWDSCQSRCSLKKPIAWSQRLTSDCRVGC